MPLRCPQAGPGFPAAGADCFFPRAALTVLPGLLTLSLMSVPDSSRAARPFSIEAEAARYALLRRLAPSMRHHLVVNLQPIGMIYEVMERRLRGAAPDLVHVHESASKINGFARAALNACIDVVSWLAPDATATTSVEDAVRECTALLATSLSFRGYALRNEVEPMVGVVSRGSVRSLLSASLLYCCDQLPGPAELVLRAQPQAQGAIVAIEVRPTPGEVNFRGELGYRKLQWADLQALAADEGAQVQGEGTPGIELRLPWGPAP
jgi:hypothetical protein